LVPPRMYRLVIILCLWNFNEQTENFCKIFTLHQREFFKKIPRLVTFCTQPVNEGSTWKAYITQILRKDKSTSCRLTSRLQHFWCLLRNSRIFGWSLMAHYYMLTFITKNKISNGQSVWYC